MAPGSVGSAYGSAAVGIEKNATEEKLQEILALDREKITDAV